jgi:polysaccharide biosynthesis/export protein
MQHESQLVKRGIWQKMDTVSGCSGRPQRTNKPADSTAVVPAAAASSASGRRTLTGSSALRGAFMIGSVAALAACTSTSDMPPAPAVPDPAVGYITNLPPYRIQVGDVLEVRLMLNPELNEEVAVRPDGHISTTVVSDAVAYNRTVPDLTEALRRDYSRDLRNPRVSVVVKSFAPTRIYVGGEVNTPGEFINVGPTLTLSQAVARAGGHKVRGDSGAVFIIRRGPDDTPQFLSTNYNAVIKGRDPLADVRLAPYDVVYVPKTGIAEVFDFFNQYLLQFVPISWGFSYVVNPGTAGTTVLNP